MQLDSRFGFGVYKHCPHHLIDGNGIDPRTPHHLFGVFIGITEPNRHIFAFFAQRFGALAVERYGQCKDLARVVRRLRIRALDDHAVVVGILAVVVRLYGGVAEFGAVRREHAVFDVRIHHLLTAHQQPFIDVATRGVPRNVHGVPHAFHFHIVPHMGLPRRGVACKRVALHAHARNAQTIHYRFEPFGKTAANGFAVYQRAVSRADIRRFGAVHVFAVHHRSAETVHGVFGYVVVHIFHLCLGALPFARARHNV